MALLVHGNPETRRAVVTAMRIVATAGGTRPFTGTEAALVRAMADVLGPASGDEPVDLSELVGDAEPFATVAAATDAVRAWLPDRADRREAIHAALLVPLAADNPDPGALHAARDLARRLGADDRTVRDLEHTATRRAHAAEADLFRRFLVWKTGEHHHTVRRRLARHEPVVATPAEAVADVRRRIDAAAPDTVGHALGQFYADTGFDIPGTPGVLPLAVLGSHDVHHVLTAYDAGAEDEVYLAVFTATNSRVGGTDYMAVILLQWHQGIKLGVFEPDRARLDPDLIAVAARRGSDTPFDLSRTDWDWEALLDVPLEEARVRLGVPPGGSVLPGGHWDATHHRPYR
ncbi:MAG: hypothetical protein ACKOOG_07420 [Actinomycetota bacterium]